MKSHFIPVLSGVLACVIWGLSVFYYKFLDQIPPLEILAHRAFWSMVFFSIILLFRRESSKVFKNILNWNSFRVYILATFLISINWFGFIFSIQVNQVTQASFGYFIFPIVAVFLGFFFNKEKFSPLQTLSISLAVIAILLLGIGLGKFPFISILLATTFGFYGLIKGRISHNPIISVATETTLIAPIALLYLFYIRLPYQGSGFSFGYSISELALLIASGLLTALPLVLFSNAVQSLRYSTVGLINYVNPTLQFLIAVFILSEEFGYTSFVAFLLIWIGLIFYSYEAFRLESNKIDRVS